MALPAPDKPGDPSEDKSHKHLMCLINAAKHNRKQPETGSAVNSLSAAQLANWIFLLIIHPSICKQYFEEIRTQPYQ